MSDYKAYKKRLLDLICGSMLSPVLSGPAELRPYVPYLDSEQLQSHWDAAGGCSALVAPSIYVRGAYHVLHLVRDKQRGPATRLYYNKCRRVTTSFAAKPDKYLTPPAPDRDRDYLQSSVMASFDYAETRWGQKLKWDRSAAMREGWLCSKLGCRRRLLVHPYALWLRNGPWVACERQLLTTGSEAGFPEPLFELLDDAILHISRDAVELAEMTAGYGSDRQMYNCLRCGGGVGAHRCLVCHTVVRSSGANTWPVPVPRRVVVQAQQRHKNYFKHYMATVRDAHMSWASRLPVTSSRVAGRNARVIQLDEDADES